jgi:hypothetical protein
MFFDIVVAVVVALIFSIGLVVLAGRRGPGPWAGFFYFFVLLFLAIWAAGVWVTPGEATGWTVSWIVFIVAGLVFALLLAVVVPPIRPKSVRPEESQREEAAEESAEIAIDFLFWVLVFVLLATIVSRYAWGLP